MNSPTPIPPTDPPARAGWAPTGSTMASGAAGLGSVAVMGVMRAFGHPVDEMTASAIVGVLMLAVNYFHPAGGRQ